jgi:hypothetical protein
MNRYYSKTTGCTYLDATHSSQMPADAVLITEARYLEVIATPTPGKIRSHDAGGLPILIDPVPHIPTAADLCQQIDSAADRARAAVAVDPLRAVEYANAATEAKAFAAADYQGDVPPMVAAWAINSRTAQQAADDILREAAQYNAALVQLRTVRLNAKELIRVAVAGGQVEQAQDIAAETIASIEAAVADIGNNSGV